MTGLLEDFRGRSQFLHGMTLDFVQGVPDQDWHFSPHPRFAPFAKQVRHIICVRGVYNDTLVTKQSDFAKKHSLYTGSLSRAELTAGLLEQQEQLLTILDTLDVGASIAFFGKQFSLLDFTYTMVQHEALHHGEWSVFASLAGFETPLSWRLNWGL